jgi:hypothetical protein
MIRCKTAQRHTRIRIGTRAGPALGRRWAGGADLDVQLDDARERRQQLLHIEARRRRHQRLRGGRRGPPRLQWPTRPKRDPTGCSEATAQAGSYRLQRGHRPSGIPPVAATHAAQAGSYRLQRGHRPSGILPVAAAHRGPSRAWGVPLSAARAAERHCGHRGAGPALRGSGRARAPRQPRLPRGRARCSDPRGQAGANGE